MEQKLVGLINKVKQLEPIKQRAFSALLGTIVADAAVRPLHWIYEVKKLTDTVGNKDPVFWPENQCPYYTVSTGGNSCYGDLARSGIQTLKKLKQNKQQWDLKQFQADIQQNFGNPESKYQKAMQQRIEKKPSPIEGPWLNGSVKTFLENYEKKVQVPGSTETMDNDGYAAVLPLILQQISNKSVNSAQIEEAFKTICNNEKNLSYYRASLQIIEGIVNDPTVDIEKLLVSVKQQEPQQILEDVVENKSQNHSNAVKLYGLPCPNPSSFSGAAHGMLVAKNYQDGVTQTLLAGGDNCSRSLLLSSVLAARDGIDSIPISWIEKTDNGVQIVEDLLFIFE